MMAVGRIGENMAQGFLNFRFSHVLDVRDDARWQEADVDFLCGPQYGIRVEAKSDARLGQTRNIFFELMRINHTAPESHRFTTGWSVRSLAHIFLIWSTDEKLLYAISATALRDGLSLYVQSKRNQVRPITVPTDRIKSTIGIPVPLAYTQHRVYWPESDGTWIQMK